MPQNPEIARLDFFTRHHSFQPPEAVDGTSATRRPQNLRHLPRNPQPKNRTIRNHSAGLHCTDFSSI